MNNSAKALVMKLDDGSVVKLAPGARIRYQAPFRLQDRRDIHLEGEADFDVAYNKKRPFTVHTKLFSTTALGTSFRVSETAMGCNVKLFTGKVMIKPVSANLKGWKKNIVLLPGHEMKYVISSGAITVDRFNAVPKKQPHRENPGKDEGIIVFDNTPLPEVMKTLNARYHSPIFYDEEQLKGKFFSGEVLGSDSLSVLLKVIANMNGLQVTKKDDGYLITPSK
jgi:ferric-dicitrate binding protein FerR (iron transport regulator)